MSRPKSFQVQSHKGPYSVHFGSISNMAEFLSRENRCHYIVDKNVYELHQPKLAITAHILLEATEENKSLDKFTEWTEKLIRAGVKRGDLLVAIGGGIIQDIVCFFASNLYRGLDWMFVPTTLLAQADSCIGSKSSVNVGAYKNIIGSFCPPQSVYIATDFLNTLESKDILSGVGEMIKVHMIQSEESFSNLEKAYEQILTNQQSMEDFIFNSLQIKKDIIEEDEFDLNIRNIMNYGHSFGHAIESATEYGIPHGIAVTIGMDMANYTAFRLGFWSKDQYLRFHPLLKKNSGDFFRHPVPIESFIQAISRDKKNTHAHLKLILPNSHSKLEIRLVENSDEFYSICKDYLENVRMDIWG